LAGRVQAWRGITLVGAMVLLLLLRGPALASAAWGNVGALALRDGLLARAMQSLRRAVALDEDDQSIRWALGRAALAMGDAKSATTVLGPWVERGWHNPLFYYDVLLALSYSGQPEQVITWYESATPLQHTEVVSDVVVLAYLDLAIVPRHSSLWAKKLDILADLARHGFCNVDLIFLDTDDIVLKSEAVRQNRMVYQAEDSDRGATYSRIVRQYLDFLPYLNVQREAYKEDSAWSRLKSSANA